MKIVLEYDAQYLFVSEGEVGARATSLPLASNKVSMIELYILVNFVGINTRYARLRTVIGAQKKGGRLELCTF